jgi:hypothetical protein
MNAKRITVGLIVLLLSVAPRLHAACSDASLHGTYGYSAQGFISISPGISPALFVPFAQSGLVTFDGKGNIPSGTFTINTTDPAGQVNRGTFTGTYVVHPDCTGSAETDNDTHIDIVVLSPMEFVANNTDVGGALIYSAKKIRAPEGR